MRPPNYGGACNFLVPAWDKALSQLGTRSFLLLSAINRMTRVERHAVGSGTWTVAMFFDHPFSRIVATIAKALQPTLPEF
jgi:hypothetical protein